MIPNEKELIEFIEKRDGLINFSMIARFFNIKNATVTDLIKVLEHKNLVEVKKLGGSKLILIKKRGKK